MCTCHHSLIHCCLWTGSFRYPFTTDAIVCCRRPQPFLYSQSSVSVLLHAFYCSGIYPVAFVAHLRYNVEFQPTARRSSWISVTSLLTSLLTLGCPSYLIQCMYCAWIDRATIQVKCDFADSQAIAYPTVRPRSSCD